MVQAMFGFMDFMTKRSVRSDTGVIVDFEFTAIAKAYWKKKPQNRHPDSKKEEQ